MKTPNAQFRMWILLPIVIAAFTGCASQPTLKADAIKAEKAQRIADRLDSRAR